MPKATFYLSYLTYLDTYYASISYLVTMAELYSHFVRQALPKVQHMASSPVPAAKLFIDHGATLPPIVRLAQVRHVNMSRTTTTDNLMV